MAEKTIPWWRKAFHYALEGIRTGFGLFSRQAKPQPAKESELSNPIEENPEESLTQPSTNPEAITAEPAELAEPLSAAQPEVAFLPVPEPIAEAVPVSDTEAPETSQAPQPFIYPSAEQLDALPTPSDPVFETQLDEEPATEAPSAAPEQENEPVEAIDSSPQTLSSETAESTPQDASPVTAESTPQDASPVTGESTPQDQSLVTGESTPPERSSVNGDSSPQDQSPVTVDPALQVPSSVTGHDFSRADESYQTEGALAPAAFSPQAETDEHAGTNLQASSTPLEPETPPTEEGNSAPQPPSPVTGDSSPQATSSISAQDASSISAQDSGPVTGHDFSRADEAHQTEGALAPEGFSPQAETDEHAGTNLQAPSTPLEPETPPTEEGNSAPQPPSPVTGDSSPQATSSISAQDASSISAQDSGPVTGHDFSRADEAHQTEGALAPATSPPEAVPVSLTSEAAVEAPIEEPEAPPAPAIDPDPESDPESDPEPEVPPAIDPDPAAPPVKEPDPDPGTAPPVKASTADVPQPEPAAQPVVEDVQSTAEGEVPTGSAPAATPPELPDSPEAEPEIAEVVVVLNPVPESPDAEIETADAAIPATAPEPQPTLETAPDSAETVPPPGPEPVVATLEPAAEPVAEADPTPAPEIATAPPSDAGEQEINAAPEPAPVAQVETAEAEPAPDLVLTNKPPVKVESRDNAADLSPFSVIVDQVYDGPLDLLLDLIRKQDIDIYDIPIAKITAQFLAYVNQLKATDVDVAGEFIYIASLLIHIKSKMLLPRADTGPDDAAEDPRRELVERLLEHERFKNAAQMLQQKQMLEAATWTNPGVREFKDDASVEPEIAADTVDLVRVFRDIIERARKRPVFNVDEDAVTVGQMIQFLARRLTMEDKPIALRRLLSHTRSERALIAMFLALLELVRLQAILLRQDLAFSEIFIKKHTGFDAVINEGLANAHDDWR